MSYNHITINERCCIVEYLNLGWSISKIAKELNRNKSSISREINRNTIIGHWELDTVVSRRGKSKASLSTFVERKTRLTKIKVMPNRKASTFNKYCKLALKPFDSNFIKTLTVDRGKEFAGYEDLEFTLNVDVYFADPYSSWQR